MSTKENNLKEKLKIALTSTAKVISDDFDVKKNNSKENKTKEFNFKDNKKEKEIDKKENKVNIFKLILVIIITFIAVIIAIETFKNQISIFFPDIIVILDNLFQSLHDIQLFIKDLVK